jgi:hypothetical protein
VQYLCKFLQLGKELTEKTTSDARQFIAMLNGQFKVPLLR